MSSHDFSALPNVEIVGADPNALEGAAQEVLWREARYCQAIAETDLATMRAIVAEEYIFTHLSGRKQTRDQYFADIESGGLKFSRFVMEDPRVELLGEDRAVLRYVQTMYANAYGKEGVFRMDVPHWYVLRGGEWVCTKGPDE